MNHEYTRCEQIRLAAMGRADGEPVPLPLEEVNSHLANCAACRREVAATEETARLLDAYHRRPHKASLADAVEQRIATAQPEGRPGPWLGMLLTLLLVMVLLTGRAFILATDAPTRWTARTVVCLVVVGWFAWRRENPFRLNTRLELSREIVS